MKYTISIKEKKYDVEVGLISGGLAQVSVNGTPYQVRVERESSGTPVTSVKPSPVQAAPPPVVKPAATVTGSGTITAPIPGLILDITVKAGDSVTAGQVVAVMEAMKMENRLITTVDGTVKEIRLAKGAHVSTGDVIMVIA